VTPSDADSHPSPAVTVEHVTVSGLERLRQLVTHAAHGAGLNKERAARLTLAVNEIATNAIQHGAGVAEVTIRAIDGCVEVDVEDDGSGISADITASRPEPDALGGRGLWLANTLCDRVDIITGQAGTRVRLVMAKSRP
jgi:anti-sigma regulatory factor (Ser/Thr protein kinase)